MLTEFPLGKFPRSETQRGCPENVNRTYEQKKGEINNMESGRNSEILIKSTL